MKYESKMFDVGLLGTGLGGLIAAARLARENHSVLVLKEKRYQPSFKREGFSFTPFSNFSEKRITSNLLKQILSPEDSVESRKQTGKREPIVFSQVILPEARIDLYQEFSVLQREWRREFPEELEKIEQLHAELGRIREHLKMLKRKEPPDSFFPVRRRSLIKRWFPLDGLPKIRVEQKLASFSSEFQKFFELQLISRGNQLSVGFPLSLVSYLLFHGEEDQWISEPPLEKGIQGLLKTLAPSGGRVEEIEGVESVEMQRKRGFTLHLKGDERMIRCRTLILNAPLHCVSSLFEKRRRVFSPWIKKIRPSYILVPIFLGIRDKVIPVGMRDLLVSIQNLEKPFDAGNLILLALSRRGAEDQAPVGKRALTVMGFKSFDGSEKGDLTDFQEGVKNHLAHLFPFLENHIEFIDRTWAESQMVCWSYPHYVYHIDSEFQWQEGIVPIRLSKNLFFTGKESFPYLGVEGEILSGRMVGEEISKKLG